MAPATTSLAVKSPNTTPYQLDPAQTLRASTALLRNIQSEESTRQTTAEKRSLLADADQEDVDDDVPVWLIVTTKKHIVDKKRLKPGKIALPHPYLDWQNENLKICLITADPQRRYKDLVTHPSFPVELGKRITRVLGLEKLKAKYKSFESRRQLLGEYDVFLADDRVITYLPGVLGKVFYKTGSKRPIPVSLEGKRQNHDDQGNKRRKLAEGGTKVVKTEVKPTDVAREVEKALGSALVHLAPSTTTAVKVGRGAMEPAQLQANVAAAVQAMVEKYVPQQWRNVRSVHIKGPNTVALPIWLAEELWVDEQDVLDEPRPVKEKTKKRKRGGLAGAAEAEQPEFVEVPGPDGQMRRIANPAKPKPNAEEAASASKKGKMEQKVESADDVAAKAVEKVEREARKAALKQQKEEAKKAAGTTAPPATTVTVTKATATTTANGSGKKAGKKPRAKAADLI